MKKTLLALALCIASATVAPAMDGVLFGRLSTPLLASAGYGLRFGDDPSRLRPTIQAEAGIGGGKLALGFDSTGEGSFGFGIKAAYLTTWLEPIEVDEDQDFLGLEGELSIKRLLLNLGGYGRIGDGEDDWLTTAGIGFVF